MKKLFLLALMLLIAVPASAKITVKYYKEWIKNKDETNSVVMFVGGLGIGMFMANTALGVEEKPQLFCPPDTLILRANNYIDILDDKIKEQSVFKTTPETSIASLLLLGLIDTFPCGKK